MAAQLPPALLSSIKTAKGFDEAAFIEVHQSGAQVVSVRLNPFKPVDLDEGFLKEKVPWSSEGYYLSSRPSFTLDPLFHAGAYYVQEASSMFLEEAVKQTTDLHKNIRVLDLCAAPGGKSTLLQSIISGESLLVSNEVIKSRANVLAENISKWGASNVLVTNNDPKDFQRLPEFFDLIVVDAPCSGSGLFRKDPKAVDEWSVNNVTLCSQRQQRILADILPSLKTGGTLIYSTCSYSVEEDEQVVDWLIREQQLSDLPLTLKPEWHIVETLSPERNGAGYRFYPDRLKGEGFFIASFRKENNSGEGAEGKLKGKPNMAAAVEIAAVSPYLDAPYEFSFLRWEENIIAMPKEIFPSFLQVQANLYLKKAGLSVGSVIRNELLPSHELAVSTILSEKLPRLELTLDNALQYLRRQEMSIESPIRGWLIVTYKDLPLGLIKLLANRVNNYYPKDWRILNK
ncbi:MAG: hypothetical protein JWQ27_1898 [Ferruginibacter sp.]|nr:hypothetical protein [Ferruginibacter sp.]